jgi:hypothetical protein
MQQLVMANLYLLSRGRERNSFVGSPLILSFTEMITDTGVDLRRL